MSSKEDFKQAIRSGNINEAFLVAMSNAPELNITTKIVTADGEKVDTGGQMDNYLHTHINLIEGKVENEIGEKLTGDRYSEIKQFHIQQVTQGHQTIQHNLVSLQKMFQLMSSFQQEAESHSNWVDIATDVTRELPSPENQNQLRGNTPNALEAGVEEVKTTKTVISFDSDEDNSEPQLPSFDVEDDEMVNDLLSLADLDDLDELDEPIEEAPETPQDRADWSEWLDDEPDVKTEVFDLKSLNIKEAKENWQNWEEQNEAIAVDADTENTES